MKIDYEGLAHVSIVVDDLYKSVEFYCNHFGAIPLQKFENFSQAPFTENLGWDSSEANNVELTTIYLIIPQVNLYFELMQYHFPNQQKRIKHCKANDLGVINHISFKIKNIEEVFEYFKAVKDVEFLNAKKDYQPMQLNKISPKEFEFFDPALESDLEEKQKVCDIVGTIKFFIIKDFNGIHWEFEQGHSDIGG